MELFPSTEGAMHSNDAVGANGDSENFLLLVDSAFFRFSFQLFVQFFLQISNFNWPGLGGAGLGTAVGPDGSERRSATAVPQPWPIEI